MNLKINLYSPKFCGGCPCLKISTQSIDSVRHYQASCIYYGEMGLNFENGRGYSRHIGDLIRPEKCIQKNGN